MTITTDQAQNFAVTLAAEAVAHWRKHWAEAGDGWASCNLCPLMMTVAVALNIGLVDLAEYFDLMDAEAESEGAQ